MARRRVASRQIKDLAGLVSNFGAQAHHGYLFANSRATRIKLLVHDGFASGARRGA